jgi:serine O-acetyltransferase
MLYACFNHTKQMRLLVVIGQKCLRIPVIGDFLSVMFEYLIRIVFSSDISCKASIPRDVIFVHGHDIVIGSAVKLGKRCKIFNGVTLGNKNTEASSNDQPTIGDDCVISTGAKILGSITVGDNCIIGANSVVIGNIPPNSVAAGVPARIIKKSASSNF